MRRQAAALVAAAAAGADAHRCAAGRPTCTRVDAGVLAAAPVSSGGKSDSGQLIRVADGRELYCLVHHAWHDCAGDQAYCCEDGSDPTHGHHHHSGEIPPPQPAGAAAGDCTGFARDLGAVTLACGNVTSCDGMREVGGPCAERVDAFSAQWRDAAVRCAVSQAADVKRLPGADAAVHAALACPMELATAGDAEDGVIDAARWDGSCDSFVATAEQVLAACGGVRCCADVMSPSSRCFDAASALYTGFPEGAFNTCVRRLRDRLRCTCFLRSVTACALQGQVHDVLYKERWSPPCNNFKAMSYQEAPGPAPKKSGLTCLLILVMAGVIAALSCALCFALRGRRRAQAAAAEAARRAGAAEAVRVEVAGLPAEKPVLGTVVASAPDDATGAGPKFAADVPPASS